MKVVGFAGFSGSGKTTLVEQLIPELRLRGLRVSVVKHAHHSFDIDHPGKDTYRHREAGAFEVVAASDKRLMLVREFEQPATLSVHHLLAELYQGVDWVLVEGFKDSDLLKIEVWRAPEPGQVAKPVRYPEDDFVVAVATPLPGTETVTTFDADGRVLAQNCISALQVPPQDNSSMDGYAVRCADVTAVGVALPITLPVSQRIAAGSTGDPLLPGTAARIFTGAPVPEGAEAILMQEDCEALATGDGLGQVRINAVPPQGQWIRRAGEDITRGAVVLSAGTRLTPAELGLAASIGLHELQVARRPPPLPRPSGGGRGAEKAHTNPAVESLGTLDLWQIAMKPGKPFAYGQI